MSECKCRGFSPTLPVDYESKELLGKDEAGQRLYLVDNAAVYVMVETKTKHRPIALLAQLYGITRIDVQPTGGEDYC